MTDIEDHAISIIASAVAGTPQRVAMVSALMRIAGNVFARLLGHDAAYRRHTELANYHHEQVCRGRGR